MEAKELGRLNVFIVMVFLVGLLFPVEPVAAGGLTWKAGDSWRIGVTLYSQNYMVSLSSPEEEARKHLATVRDRYIVEAKVIGIEEVRGHNCWVVQYTPLNSGREYWIVRNAPKNSIQAGMNDSRCWTWISQENGVLVKATSTQHEQFATEDIPVRSVSNASYLEYAVGGFPADMLRPDVFDAADSNELTDNNLKLTMEAGREDKVRKVKLGLVLDGEEEWSVVQTWLEGATFWSEYERWHTGHIYMEASVIGPQLSQKFEALYRDWTTAVQQEKTEEADQKYKQIAKMGIAIVPEVIHKIETGQDHLVSLIAELTHNQLEKTATKQECLEWWEKNKKYWQKGV